MVSPAGGWEDTKHGYENDDVAITVREIRGSDWGDDRSVNFTRWQVQVRRGPPGYAQIEDLAEYDEPRPAWELAHMLTHLFDEYGDDRVIMSLTDPEKGDRPERSESGPTEADPETHLRNCLGDDDHLLDAVPE
mgnify:FL=1